MTLPMIDAHKQFHEVFNELYTLTIPMKIGFFEALQYNFTIASRSIWSEDEPSDAEKVEAFKWLNELSHRIWIIQFELQRGEDIDSINRLYQNMKFYGEQSNLLRGQLVPTTLASIEKFRAGM